MTSRLAKVTAAIVAILAIALAFTPGAAFAQSTGTGGGAGGTTAPGAPAAQPSHGREIDLPIGGPLEGFEEEEPEPDPPDEDDPPQIYDEDIPTRSESLIYVIDISGSMGWDYSTFPGLDGQPMSGHKLDRAKVELRRSINALTDEWKFNIIAFDCYMYRWRGTRQQATPQNKTAAAGWINSLQPQGATGTGPAVALGLQERDNLTIALLSDGAPNCVGDYYASIPEHRQIIRGANAQRATIHTFGIGAYGEFERFLRDVAADSGGRYYPVN